MTKDFIKRVKREMIVDTRRYRYVGGEVGGEYTIKRIDIDLLDRTAALDRKSWQIVYREERA